EQDEEAKTLQNRKDSAIHHLIRLLAAPGKEIGVEEFFPPPPDAVHSHSPTYDSDDANDEQAISEKARRAQQLAEKIKEAREELEPAKAAEMQKECHALMDEVAAEKAARKRGRKKKCGPRSPIEKINNNMSMAMSRLRDRFRENGLPKLADHLGQ